MRLYLIYFLLKVCVGFCLLVGLEFSSILWWSICGRYSSLWVCVESCVCDFYIVWKKTKKHWFLSYITILSDCMSGTRPGALKPSVGDGKKSSWYHLCLNIICFEFEMPSIIEISLISLFVVVNLNTTFHIAIPIKMFNLLFIIETLKHCFFYKYHFRVFCDDQFVEDTHHYEFVLKLVFVIYSLKKTTKNNWFLSYITILSDCMSGTRPGALKPSVGDGKESSWYHLCLNIICFEFEMPSIIEISLLSHFIICCC